MSDDAFSMAIHEIERLGGADAVIKSSILSISIKTAINDVLNKQEKDDWESIYENHRKSIKLRG